jgi:hypothetical protein
MRKLGTAAFVVLGCALATGCPEDENGHGTPGVISTVDAPFVPPPYEWRATLFATSMHMPLNGDVFLRQTPGEAAFLATLTIRNDANFATRPWHVDLGTCGSGGLTIGGRGAYPPLSTGSDGAGVVTITIRTGLDPFGVYSVIVQHSEDDPRPLACGDFLRQ